MEESKTTTYNAYHRKYYEKHKEVIAEKRKESAREYSKRYYAEHKDQINAKRRRKGESQSASGSQFPLQQES